MKGHLQPANLTAVPSASSSHPARACQSGQTKQEVKAMANTHFALESLDATTVLVNALRKLTCTETSVHEFERASLILRHAVSYLQNQALMLLVFGQIPG